MPTIAGVAERLEPCRLGAAVRMLRMERVVAPFSVAAVASVAFGIAIGMVKGRTCSSVEARPRAADALRPKCPKYHTDAADSREQQILMKRRCPPVGRPAEPGASTTRVHNNR
jgi:hypothetical protein